jgi:hypothetical protein
MFTKDIYVHYGGHKKYGEAAAVYFARAFIVVITLIAYAVALYLKQKQGIFEIAIRFAFSGFAAMAPVMIAALFWKRSTKYGALAATLFVAATLIGFACLQGSPALPQTAGAKPVAKITKSDATPQTASIHVADTTNSAVVAITGTNTDTATVHTAAGDVLVQGATNIPTTNANTNVTTKLVSRTEVLEVHNSNNEVVAVVTNSEPAKIVAAPAPEVKPAAPAGPPKPKMNIIWKVGDHVILSRTPATGDVRFWNSSANPAGGYMTVVPMVFGSALCMIIFSLLTRPPSRETIDKYFSEGKK